MEIVIFIVAIKIAGEKCAYNWTNIITSDTDCVSGRVEEPLWSSLPPVFLGEFIPLWNL